MIRRLWVVFGLLVVLYLAVVSRLFYWQILNSEPLKVKAASQYGSKVKIPPKRGEILTADGSPLVVNQPSYEAYAEPQNIEDKYLFAHQLATYINEPQDAIFNLINAPNRRWVSLAKKVTNNEKDQLEQLSLKGLGFDSTSMRFYPEASMAAHLLGFVGYDQNGNEQGYFGLEGYYNQELSGKDGSVKQEYDAKGAPILLGDPNQVDPENGSTLVLWLDRSIQFIVERRLLEGINKYGAVSGIAIAMNPKTGGILAMASYPNYDPTHYEEFDDSLYKNPAVGTSYEPGSTFKPLVMSAAVNEHLLTGDSTFNESGPVRIGQYSIRTWDDQYHGIISMTDVLRYSSNVGMVYVQRQLGQEKMIQYIKGFGFGEKTNVDLEDESSPELRPIRDWSEIDYATSSFGQGIAVSPLQLVRAIGAIANGGFLMEPHVVKEIHDASGKVIPQKDKSLGQILTKNTTQELTRMMVTAVKYGEAKWAAPKGYDIAGKTGTAQIPVEGHYDASKTIASFVGFAPAADPKIVMLVILNQPETSEWGSETAAPVFFQILKDVFGYMGIAPSAN